MKSRGRLHRYLAFLCVFLFSCASASFPTVKGPDPAKIWDFRIDGYDLDAAKNGYYLEEFRGIRFSLAEEGYYDAFLAANGERIVAKREMPNIPIAFYVADLNLDGYRELCLQISIGSGFVHEEVEIYDFHNKESLLLLSDRSHFDYHLLLNDEGALLVEELSPRPEQESFRTGFFSYQNGQLNVLWNEDR